MSYNQDKRRSFSKKWRESFIAKHSRICHWCLQEIGADQPWDVEHCIPRELLPDRKADSDDNLRPIHRNVCHPAKTALDRRMITKSNHVRAKHGTDGTPPKTKKKIPQRTNSWPAKGTVKFPKKGC